MSNNESIYIGKTTKEMNQFFGESFFPEFQTIAMMIFENEKKVEFQEFQVFKEQHVEKGEVLSYNLTCMRDDRELPLINICGTQVVDSREPLKIILDYLTLDGQLKEEYILFEDGEFFFN
ncbi:MULTISPECIES: hypothetical protein [Bacillus]|uniref:hypothetical protein n=1 Tax=Bacillus TaxID=1386 RepID=UPI0002F1972B|nr:MULTISPECIES: hypothetical protein [Bacillus]